MKDITRHLFASGQAHYLMGIGDLMDVLEAVALA